jgi:hypothetical protein
MSEKTKTPRELAEEYIKATNSFDPSKRYFIQHAYLAGLEAGAKMGWEAAVVRNDGTWDYEPRFSEWWASLAQAGEGEKSST